MPAHPGIFFFIALGFAIAGVIALGYEIVTRKRASFRLLGHPRMLPAVIPFLAFSAPFIILRNTIRGCQVEGRPAIAVAVAFSLVIGWSAASGAALTTVIRNALL